MIEPYYYRPSDFVYRLASAPTYCWYTGRGGNNQLLIGIADDKLVEVFFDELGTFLHHCTTTIPQEQITDWVGTSNRIGLAFQKLVDLGFELSIISICRFWISELRVGIEDLFDTGKELHLDPSSFSEEDKQYAVDSVKIWNELGQYVFWWHSDFYIGREGQVEAS